MQLTTSTSKVSVQLIIGVRLVFVWSLRLFQAWSRQIVCDVFFFFDWSGSGSCRYGQLTETVSAAPDFYFPLDRVRLGCFGHLSTELDFAPYFSLASSVHEAVEYYKE